MKTQSEFSIPYLGLANGIHEYDFLIEGQFFLSFETSNIKEGRFEVVVYFDKRDRLVVLEIEGHGHYEAPCDRCLVDINIPMNFKDRIILKFQEEVQSDTAAEVCYLDPKTSHIDISPFIYEAIHLNMPIKNVRDCEAEEQKYCDQNVLKNLKSTISTVKTEPDDSPWNELKKLNLD